MWILGWLIVGVITGYIATRFVLTPGEGVVLNIVLGIIGAVIGGVLMMRFGPGDIAGNVYGLLLAIVGAIVVLFAYHSLFGRRTP
ncbi:MAG: hypothetical protein QOK29_103 [Rhodospirillaceae bacterium]|jgi:uncharacterized membrane protein YeaQ/YmgE (transglycosylase-associated protein family)|nr:hypothetical protein [Rhodospirillaceae bacterium]